MKISPMRRMLWLSVVLCFASAYVVSVEDGEVTVTVSNGTPRYLHVAIDNEPFLYVAPGGNARMETRLMTAYVEVFYSPGQGISGRAVRELTSTVTYTDRWSNTCHHHDSGGCSVNDSDSRGVTRTPMSWSVTPADLAADTTSYSD